MNGVGDWCVVVNVMFVQYYYFIGYIVIVWYQGDVCLFVVGDGGSDGNGNIC